MEDQLRRMEFIQKLNEIEFFRKLKELIVENKDVVDDRLLINMNDNIITINLKRITKILNKNMNEKRTTNY